MKFALALPLVMACASLPTYSAAEKTPSSNFLWYEQPARVKNMQLPWGSESGNLGDAGNNPKNPWEQQALPIGNGRVGAMIFGGDKTERLALNEVSFWSGGENPNGGYANGPNCSRDQFGCYLPFGDLIVSFDGDGEAQNYRRSLNLEDGIARVSYKKKGVEYKRLIFASEPAQVIVMQCEASQPGKLGAKLTFKPSVPATISASGNSLVMSGKLKNGLEFEAVAVVIPEKGKVTGKGGKKEISPSEEKGEATTDMSQNPYLELGGAQGMTVIISMATDYVMDPARNWKGTPPAKRNKVYLSKAIKTPVEQLKADHVSFYKKLFDRVQLDLGKSTQDKASLPTDKRIKDYKKNPNDPELEKTVYQYGRYALIAGSRPGNLPANLQGIWNNSVTPPWNCDYHNNINVQMCYWGAEVANLSECHEPLLDYLTAMAPGLREATQKGFKKKDGSPARGWTARTSQNIWGASGWAWNIPASAWYALHLWEHYRFTNNKTYLKEQAYPMMKEICQFWEDSLKELGQDGAGFHSGDKNADLSELKGIPAGTLVAPNGWSPEQGPREDGVAHDQQLIWELFDDTIKAAKILKTDAAWAKQLAEKRDRLYLHKISKQGYLQEWMIDRPNLVTGHRHTSHLFGAYPGSIISVDKTPEVAKAAEKSLELRGSDGDCRRSWTWPWRTALWARFRNGENAHEMVAGLIKHNMLDNMIATHAPLQFDGTYGITGGISEMLLQSHDGKIRLLPAIPEAWKSGSVKGLKARGNLTVDIDWRNGKVTRYKLTSPAATPAPVEVVVNGSTKKVRPESTAAKKAASATH